MTDDMAGMDAYRTSDKRIADYESAKLKANLFAEFSKLRGDNFDFESQPITNTSVAQDSAQTITNYRTCSTVETLIEYRVSQSEKRPRTLMEVNTARK
jgi:hypothetical protein